MNIQNAENELINELNNLLAKYENRIRLNNGIQHKHVEKKDAAKIVGTGATIGAAIGTVIPIPGAGNAIGAAAGALLALGVVAAIEGHNRRKNMKVDNSAAIQNHLGNVATKYQHIRQAAHQVIQERAAMLNTINDTATNRQSVAKYLAANMMSALKHTGAGNRTAADIMADGVQNTYSKKVSSHHLSTNNNQDISLRTLARTNENEQARRPR